MGLGAAVSLSASPNKKAAYLVRRYRAGSRIVYQTNVTTHIRLQSDPRGLKNYLPGIPIVVTVRPENTVVVQAVHPDKSAEIRDRFDSFNLITTVTADPSGHTRVAASKVENAFAHEITGETLTAHYGPHGRLLGFTGAAALLSHLRFPERGAAHWGLELLLSTLGGYGFYPNHPVQVGETWESQDVATLGEAVPLASDHQNTYRLARVIRYHGVKAGVIVFDVANSIHSVRGIGPSPGLFTLLKNEGVTLEIGASGSGSGQAIVSLKDGRILQEEVVMHETFQGSVQGLRGVPLPPNRPASLRIETDTAMNLSEAPTNPPNLRQKLYGANGGTAYRLSQRQRNKEGLMRSAPLLQPAGEHRVPKAADAESD